MTKQVSNGIPSNGGDACPCHLTAATHARAVIAAAARLAIVVTAAAAQRALALAAAAQRAHVIAAAARLAIVVTATAATSMHADTAGIHILCRVGVTGGIVAFAHFYIQTGDFLYAESGCGRTFKVATQARHSKEENRRLFVYRP